MLLEEQLESIIRRVVRSELQQIQQALPGLGRGDDPDGYITTREAADLAKRTPETIRAWVSEGKLQRHGGPGRVLVRRSELRAVLERGRGRPVESEEPDNVVSMAKAMRGER